MLHFNFLDMTAEQRVRGRVVGIKILGAVIFTSSQIVAELTHTPFQFLNSVTGLVQMAHNVHSGHVTETEL
jgi:hypothetical protein